MINTNKKSRGRPKGSTGSHFVNVKLEDLIEGLGHEATVLVSKSWYKALEKKTEEKALTPVDDEPRIQFTTID